MAGVQAPLLNIPAPVSNLDAIQRGSNLIAHFTLPAFTTESIAINGSLSPDLRVGVSPDPWNQSQWENSARRVKPSSIENGLANYVVPASEWIGKDVVMAVRVTGENGKTSPWSRLLALPVVAPPAQPQDVKLTPDPKGIRITWRAAGAHFRVLRQGPDETSFAPLAVTTTPEYFDATPVMGKTYIYQVLTFAPLADNREAESDLSPAATITFKDVFPPAAPHGLRAAASAGSIELSWESNDEPDLAGYRVYRSVDGAAFEKVGDVNLPAYSDKTAQPGHAYRYQVTAIDQSGNESDRSAIAEAALR